MQFHDEDTWVYGVSPHTGRPKTQICLPLVSDQSICQDGEIVSVPGLARVGCNFQVTGENGGPHLGRIEVLAIASVDVRHTLSRASVTACGFSSRRDLLSVWAHRYDTRFYDQHLLGSKRAPIRSLIVQRPFWRYLAWLISFKPVPVK